MGWFTPYKKRANSFNYIPRYYDPQHEAREQRRAELSGYRLDDKEEYVPGKYIRTQREARSARREKERAGGRGGMLKLVLLSLFLLFVVGVLFPRIVQMLTHSKRQPMTVEQYYGDFDPSAPITIVPNDYQEE